MTGWRRRESFTPGFVVKGWLAAICGIVVLRSWADPILRVAFPHWNDWSTTQAGDVIAGLLAQIGIAIPVVFIAWRVLGFLASCTRRAVVNLRS